MKDIRVIITRDGSHSLYVPRLDETYHSSYGAITESEHIFIQAGLEYFHQRHSGQNSLTVFELGFGTGLNALLTYRYAFRNHLHLKYFSIESEPLPVDFALGLNYPERLAFEDSRKIFRALHESPWNGKIMISDFFLLEKIHQKIENYQNPHALAEIIFYDAFAPGVQPDVWDKKILAGMYDLLKAEGVLVTYCVQGQFRRDLKAAGFHVEKLPGPPGKKEIVRALKTKSSSQV